MPRSACDGITRWLLFWRLMAPVRFARISSTTSMLAAPRARVRSVGGRLRVSATECALVRHRPLLASLGGQLHFDKIVRSGLGLEGSLEARHLTMTARGLDGWEYEPTSRPTESARPST